MDPRKIELICECPHPLEYHALADALVAAVEDLLVPPQDEAQKKVTDLAAALKAAREGR